MKQSIIYFLFILFVHGSLGAQEDLNLEKVLIRNARQLIYEGKRSGEGYFSHTGKQLIFQSEREEGNPFYQIYMLDFETGDIHRVSPGIGKTTCAFFDWSSDNRVLFASTHHDTEAVTKQKDELDFRSSGKQRRYSWDYDMTMDIFSADRDGGNIKQLTDAPGYDAEGAYSPDGQKIVFCSLRDAYTRELSEKEKKLLEVDQAYFGEIYIMDADGSNQKRLTFSPGYDGGSFFNHDGSKIIWRRFSEDGITADVFTMDLEGNNQKQITDFRSMSWAPYFHPSDEYIIFASNKYGFDNFELFLVDAEGVKEPIRVTNTPGFDGLPVFSPDGLHLSWTTNRTSFGRSQIYYADWNHDKALELLEQAPFRNQQEQFSFTSDISKEELKQKVAYLASDELEGRMTGSPGIEMAAEFITDHFEHMGVEKIKGSYLQEFPFISSVEVNTSQTELSTSKDRKKQDWSLFDDYVPMSFSSSGEFEGQIVFAGYGLKTPPTSDIDYNSYANIDVKDKAVVAFYDLPSHFSDDEKKSLLRYASPRYKALMAREMGAKAIFFVDPSDSGFSRFVKDNLPGNSGILSLKVRMSLLDHLLQQDGKSIEAIQEQFENYNPHAENEFEFSDQVIALKVGLDKKEKSDNNVFGMISATNPSDDFIMIGGHYDHLGRGESGSLAENPGAMEIHNGADDNASGTAVVMELAEYFAQWKQDNPELMTKNLVFALWSGEELGLIGSNHYANEPLIPMDQTIAYLNYDMVGMIENNQLILQGLGSSSDWKKTIEKKNILAGFNLVLQDDPYVPTDAMSMYQGGVPILCFFSGIHDHYHRPTDDVELLNYEGMARVTNFSANIIKDLLQQDAPGYAKVEMSQTRAASSRGFSVYLGTIPDYVAEVEGVQLSGVRAGGPAEKAGIQKGDIIIKLGGKDIKNIYDYTYILGDLKANEEVEIIVMRKGKEKVINITPIAR